MSSKRRLRRRACERKQRHPTANDANRHAAHLRRRGSQHAVYPCGDHWHVGTPNADQRRSRRAKARNRRERT
jgi:hypothetical protein